MTKQELEQFVADAKASRVKHSVNERLLALEFMVSALAASLEGNAKENFLKTVNAFSEKLDPMQDSTLKALADLNVLSSDFKDLASQLAGQK